MLTEPSLNDALAEVLSETLDYWHVRSEQTRVFRDRPSSQPDITVGIPGRATVLIENEFAPASTVEEDARSRLGLSLASGEQVKAVIALVSDPTFKRCHGAREARERIAQDAVFRYCLCRQDSRFPRSGYLQGGVADLVWFILHAGIPPDALDRAIRTLSSEVESAISILADIAQGDSDLSARFALLLKQDFADETMGDVRSVEQAYGIISTVMLNAMMYQQRLAEGTTAIRSLSRLRSDDELTQTGVMEEWRRILDINYFSIFDLARNLLGEIHHAASATKLVRRLATGADKLTSEGVSSSEDLSGVVFQRFITDRKYLATFYTKPQSAALLAQLAIPSWDDESRYKGFRVADLACGTGTLIHAAYRRLSVLQELAGGVPRTDHSHMMANALTAADIVPSAAHLTASMLSSVYPSQSYDETRVLIPHYGQVGGGGGAEQRNDVRLGSMELMSQEAQLKLLLPTSSRHQRISGAGEQEAVLVRETPHASQDVLIMNPPFTRAGSDWDHSGTHVRQYRGLGTSKKDQQLMGQRQAALFRNTCFHGYAGLGSAFMALADKMVKDRGTLAFVLPLTVASGSSWQKVRDLVREKYGDLIVVSIADEPDAKRTFSADTDMAEVLLVARRNGLQRTKFVCLHAAPDSTLLAHEVGRAILDAEPKPIGGSLTGGTPILVGDDLVGRALSAPWSDETWGVVGVRDLLLAQVMYHLSNGILWLPRLARLPLPVCRVADNARIGLNDMNVAGAKSAPFTRSGPVNHPIYPVLWNHDADKERSLFVSPDQELEVKDGMDQKANDLWAMRSRAHFSRGTRLTSQSLTACLTPERCLGGSAWPTVQMKSKEQETAYVLWANSTLGCMLHWYWGGRQQTGRALFSVTGYARLPTLDVSRLSKQQLQQAMTIMKHMATAELRPMNEAAMDDVRHDLDRRLLVDMLGFPTTVVEGLGIVRNRWVSEPSVHGGKKSTGREPIYRHAAEIPLAAHPEITYKPES